MHFFKNTSLGCLFLPQVKVISKWQTSQFATRRGWSCPPSSRLSSALLFIQLCSQQVRRVKESAQEPNQKRGYNWPLLWLPEPTHPGAAAAATLARGRRDNASAGKVQTTLLEAVRPRLAAMMPHLWHLHKTWPHVQPLSSEQGRTQKNPIHTVQSKTAGLPSEPQWATKSQLLFWPSVFDWNRLFLHRSTQIQIFANLSPKLMWVFLIRWKNKNITKTQHLN